MSISIKPLNGDFITKEHPKESEFLVNNHNKLKDWSTQYTDIANNSEKMINQEEITNKLKELKSFLTFDKDGEAKVDFLINLSKTGVTPNLAEVMFILDKRGVNTEIQRTSSGNLQKYNFFHLEKEQKNIESVINKNPKIQELINEIATKKNLSTEKKSKLIRFIEKTLETSNKAVVLTSLAEGIEKIIDTNMRGELIRSQNNNMDYNQMAKMFADMMNPKKPERENPSPGASFGMNS